MHLGLPSRDGVPDGPKRHRWHCSRGVACIPDWPFSYTDQRLRQTWGPRFRCVTLLLQHSRHLRPRGISLTRSSESTLICTL